MGVILILILASLLVATGFLAAFIWAVRSGQFEDTCTPSMRILPDDGAKDGEQSRIPAARDAFQHER
jgi:cbb3-type cytochrome oxidase maturation protein